MTSFGEYPSIVTPFAAGDVNIQRPDVSFGISATDSCPFANGGTQISRHKMNGLGYLATLGAFLDRVGYPYGYDETISYPKGAIVTIFNTQTNRIEEYLNTVDNNTNSPPIGTNYSQDSAYNGWVTISKIADYSFLPDYTNRELLATIKVTSGNSEERTFTPTNAGWVHVVRTIEGWEDLDLNHKLGFGYTTVDVRLGIYNPYQLGSNDEMSIKQNEGGTASRFFPCPTTFPLQVSRVPEWIKSVSVNVYLYGLEG